MKNYNEFINENNKWIYEGDFDVYFRFIKNGGFIEGKIPDEVTGTFNCNGNNLTSLIGGPNKIGRHFYCNDNNLTSLEGGPSFVSGRFICKNNKLISLEGAPLKVNHLKSDLKIENSFINNGYYKKDYWPDLLGYMISKNIDLGEVKGWPDGFLNDNIIKSVNKINKFKL